MALGATGTHPWADYREQPIIDTEHYRRVEDGLKYVAWRNNTFSLHVHVGVRDIDRAVRVCDRLRPRAAAAAGDLGQLAVPRRPRQRAALGAHARASPRASRAAASPTRSAAGAAYREYIEFLLSGPTRSSSSPRSGGRCGRTSASAPSRCASATRRPTPQESDALAALMVACIAQAVRDVDEGVPFERPGATADRGEHVAGDPLRARRAADRPASARDEYPAREAIERLARVDRAGARASWASSSAFPERNGAQRQRRDDRGRRHVARRSSRPRSRETRATYPQEVARMSAEARTCRQVPEREVGAGAPAPTEEELRAAYEAELSRITATDMIAQAAVSLLNIGARRLGPPPDSRAPRRARAGTPRRARPRAGARRDRRRAGAAGDPRARGSRSELRPLRDALSRLQMAYARRGRRRARRGRAARPPGSRRAERPSRRSRRARPRRARSAADRGRPSPAAGCGCPAGERRRGARGVGVLRKSRPPRPPDGTGPFRTIDCARVCAG